MKDLILVEFLLKQRLILKRLTGLMWQLEALKLRIGLDLLELIRK